MLTPEQITARRKGIGGSDAAAVCGLSKWKTPLNVYNEKLGLVDNNVSNRFTHFGQLLEPIIATEYERISGLKCHILEELIIHPQYTWMIGNVDRLVLDGSKKVILECKTASMHTQDQWGEQGTDQIPNEYLLQCAHYAIIYDAERVDIAVLIGGNDFRIYTYRRNKKLEEGIIAAEHKFWHEHILTQTPPLPQTLEDTAHLWSIAHDKICQADNNVLAKAYDLLRLKKQMSLLEQQEQSLKTELQAYMKEANSLLDIRGKKLATWYNQSTVRLDVAKLKEDKPEIYQAYLTQNQMRVFRLNHKLEV